MQLRKTDGVSRHAAKAYIEAIDRLKEALDWERDRFLHRVEVIAAERGHRLAEEVLVEETKRLLEQAER